MKSFKEFKRALKEEINMNPFFDRMEVKGQQFVNLKKDLNRVKILFKEVAEFFLEFNDSIESVSTKLNDIGFKNVKKTSKTIEKQKKDTHIILSNFKNKVRLELV